MDPSISKQFEGRGGKINVKDKRNEKNSYFVLEQLCKKDV